MQDSVHQGRTIERSEEGVSRSEARLGTLAELTEYLDSLSIGTGDGGMQIRRARLTQVGGAVWKCEIEASNASDGSAGGALAPSDAYGVKSAQLSCGMLSVPIERHKKYRVCWNYYLGGCDTVIARTEKIDGKDVVKYSVAEAVEEPDWWEDRTGTTLTLEEALKYRWVKSPSELPLGVTKDGRIWRILKEPKKPGTDNYDLSTYQVTESSKFKSPRQAGKFVATYLNRIVTPSETFSITGGDWKVDSASISWDGKRWKATLTYTLSGNEKGWDTDLYRTAKPAADDTRVDIDKWKDQIRNSLNE